MMKERHFIMSEEKQFDDPVVAAPQIQYALGLTAVRISQLADAGVIKKGERNQYHILESTKNYVEFLKKKTISTEDGPLQSYNTERTRLIKHKADLAEIQKEQVSSKLIPAADVEIAWSTMAANAKQRLLAISTKVASEIFASQHNMNSIRDIVHTEIVEALEELSNVQVRTVNPIAIADDGDDADEGDRNPEATTKTNGKPVGRPKSKTLS